MKNITKFAKKITLFLMDGEVNGRLTCDLSNWSGKAYKIPRTTLKDMTNKNELNSTGVYFLFGYDEAKSIPCVYIGEAESTIIRLKQHLYDSDKNYWNEAVVIISKDNNLNKAHIKYLENKFYLLAKGTGRYTIMNASTPAKSQISEADEAELEEFLYNSKLIMGALGYKLFEPLISNDEGSDSNITNEVLYFKIKNGENGDARGIRTNEGFVVLKGSYLSQRKPSNNSIAFKLRERYKDSINEDFITTEDVIFASPSGAGSFIYGQNTNGLTNWKNKDGKTLKEIEKEF